jgi:poly-gamma-glutamate biosynthesis protein PgsC/CapC
LTAADLIYPAIGIGLVLSLVFSEVFGLAAGGMVVPGYIALEIHHPLRVAGTVLTALATLGAVKAAGRLVFLYGRRRLALTILVGFLMGWLSDRLFVVRVGDLPLDAAAIGFIVPGLIANWMERQGVVETLAAMLIGAVLVRLALTLLTGGAILP